MSLFLALILFLLSQSNTNASDIIYPSATLVYTADTNNRLALNINLSLTNKSNSKTVISEYMIPIPEESSFTNCSASYGKVFSQNNMLILQFDKKGVNAGETLKTQITCFLSTSEIENLHILRIPLFLSDIKVRQVDVTVPNSWGNLLVVDQSILRKVERKDTTTYMFKSNNLYASFVLGDKLIYNFKVSKQIRNDGGMSDRLWEIPLFYPDETAHIIYTKINPRPTVSYKDGDGNIFLVYKINPNSELSLEIEGYITHSNITSKNIDTVIFNTIKNSPNMSYWILKDSLEKKKLAVYLQTKGFDIENAYSLNVLQQKRLINAIEEYVIKNLTPISIKSNSIESVERAGATSVLNHKNSASPEDYVDLMIAMARIYGYKVRMVDGLVVDNKTLSTSNQRMKPFFNSWIEVWIDNEWVQIDPFLDDINNGLTDFSKQSDFNHISYIKRERNPLSPRIGFLTPEDISFNISSSIPEDVLSVSLEQDDNGNVTIINNGNIIINDITVSNKDELLNIQALDAVLVPNGSVKLQFGSNMDNRTVKISLKGLYGQRIEKDITISVKPATDNKNSTWTIIYSLTLSVIIYTILLILVNKVFYLWGKK